MSIIFMLVPPARYWALGSFPCTYNELGISRYESRTAGYSGFYMVSTVEGDFVSVTI